MGPNMAAELSRQHRNELLREAEQERLAAEAIAQSQEARAALEQASLAHLKATARVSRTKPVRARLPLLARLGLRPA